MQSPVYENIYKKKNSGTTQSSPVDKSRKRPCARALFSFKAERPDELPFSKGVSILLIRRVNADWLEGQLGDRIGIFPAEYVKIEVGLPSAKEDSELANSGLPYARALHKFSGGNEGDLPFKEGDLIQLVSWGQSGWLLGKAGDKEGMFPASYVDVIIPLPSPQIKRRAATTLINGVMPPVSSGSPIPLPRTRSGSSVTSEPRGSGAAVTGHTHPRPRSATMKPQAAVTTQSLFSPLALATSPSQITPRLGTSPSESVGSPSSGPSVSSYVLQSGSRGCSDSSSSEEGTTGTVAVLKIQPATSSPSPKSKSRTIPTNHRYSLNIQDSMYMNEEPNSYARSLPVSQTPVAPPRKSKSSRRPSSPKDHEYAEVNESATSYCSNTLSKMDKSLTNAVPKGPVPIPRTTKASGAPHRLPPLPPSPDSLASTIEEEDEDKIIEMSSNPIQKINEKMAEIREMLTSQEKLIQSACGLLRVTQDDDKRFQLFSAIESREKVLENLHRELQILKDEKIRLQSETAPRYVPMVPVPPPGSVDKAAVRISYRNKVISEIIETEKEYHRNITTCIEYIIPFLKEVEVIDCDILFGNMEAVCEISAKLLETMEQDKEYLGRVFLYMSKFFFEVYTVYCKNHNLATICLRKYYEDPALSAKLKESVYRIKDKTSSWDIGSILIQPVQRIMRYHLLLTQLRKETEIDHDDMKDIQKAEQKMREVADAINEAKRRIEIVEKYTDPANKSVNISKVNMRHSVSKKMDRLITAMTQFAGLRTKTIDTKFEDERQRFLDMQELYKSLLKGIQAWLKGVKDTFDSRQHVTVTMVECCSDRPPRLLAKYGEAIYSGLQATVKSHIAYIELNVLEPLKATLAQFQEPSFLIHKRDQKLLDFDHVNHELEKAKESEKISTLKEDRKIARKTYTALNQQLLEDLPLFRSKLNKMYLHLLAVFTDAQLKYHLKCRDIWTAAVINPNLITSSAAIHDLHSQRLSIACQRSLSQLRTITTTSLTGTLRTRKTAAPSQDTHWPLTSPDMSPEPEDIKEGQCLCVLYDFDAEEQSVELSVQKGNIVYLIAPHDQLGCPDWWLVRKEDKKGYVPASYLKIAGGLLKQKENKPEMSESLLNESFEAVATEKDEASDLLPGINDDCYTLDSFVTCSDVTNISQDEKTFDQPVYSNIEGSDDGFLEEAVNIIDSNKLFYKDNEKD